MGTIHTQHHNEEPSSKKTYVSPQLIIYGDVRKLTASGGGPMPGDAGTMMP